MSKHNLARYWMEIGFGLLFFLLLYRAPFSSRTLIPNFEPYPDSFHYLVPAQHLLAGRGLTMDRIGTILPGVPPLYSLTLVPFFWLVNDPRMAYYANLVLSLSSYLVFVALCRRHLSSRLVRLPLYLLFVTHPVLIWYVELVMAEHLALLLFLGSLWLVGRRGGNRQRFTEGLISPLLYATKYAAAPLSFALLVVFGLRSLWQSLSRRRLAPLLILLSGALLCTSLYLALTHAIRGSSELDRVMAIFQAKETVTGVQKESATATPNDPFFGTKYARNNLQAYGKYLFGTPLPILWKTEQLLPVPLAILGVVGWLLLWRRREDRWFALAVGLSITSTLAFLALFYVVDGRYVYHFIPLAILGVGVTLQASRSLVRGPRTALLFALCILVLCAGYAGLQARRLKFRASLNFRHAETPWYYQAVREIDTYLAQQPRAAKPPVIISAMPPFLFDFYAKERFILLPLHRYQEFRNATTQAWGEHDYTNLPGVYESYLAAGHSVYLTAYGLGNEGYLQQEFAAVRQQFGGELVKEGCHGLCSIYRLKRISK